METSLLVNIVHNDFQSSDAIFEPFFKAGAEHATENPPALNGATTNGHAN